MFTFRRHFTPSTLLGVTLTGVILTGNSWAAETPYHQNIARAADAFVSHAAQVTKQDLAKQAVYEVLTASHQFEPTVQPKQMVAKISIHSVNKERESIKNANNDDV